jgi:hypothetical protein
MMRSPWASRLWLRRFTNLPRGRIGRTVARDSVGGRTWDPGTREVRFHAIDNRRPHLHGFGPCSKEQDEEPDKCHPQSFYLTSLEAIFAATLQKMSLIPSRSSGTGYFAFRLVAAVLTGREDGAIDISAYQVFEQAVAMVDADVIEASVEPGIVCVKDEDRSQDAARYVPDVFFGYKNEYGLEVKKTAKPSFPVEYLPVNVRAFFMIESVRILTLVGESRISQEQCTIIPFHKVPYRESTRVRGPRSWPSLMRQKSRQGTAGINRRNGLWPNGSAIGISSPFWGPLNYSPPETPRPYLRSPLLKIFLTTSACWIRCCIAMGGRR